MNKRKLFTSFLSVLIVTFLTIGGCGGNGGDDDMSADMGMDSGEEPALFQPGGQLADPQTFTYVEGGGERQQLDYYAIEGSQEANEGPRPVVIWVHGGAWVDGSKEAIPLVTFDLAEEIGFHLISINYRFANDESAPWPAIVQDVNAAIRWVKQNAEMLNANPDVIVLSGFSVGAHLASLAATSSEVEDLQGNDNPGSNTNVSALILFSGVYDTGLEFPEDTQNIFFSELGCDEPSNIDFVTSGLAGLIGLLIDDPGCLPVMDNADPLAGCDQNLIDQSSPLSFVDSSDPPMYLVHGTDDCVALRIHSILIAQALDNAGVFNVFDLVEGANHGLVSIYESNLQNLVDFLEIALGAE